MKKIFFKAKELDLATPAVMGILNITSDSFYDYGLYQDPQAQLQRVGGMINAGAKIIDVGAVSTRPGAPEVTEEEEIKALIPAIKRISARFPEVILSADTFRAVVAQAAVGAGADMINDIYGGRYEPGMIQVIASMQVPYVLMHMQGTPLTMQENPTYNHVTEEVYNFFENQLDRFREAGIRQVILDPGFGFGKTIAHNYRLLAEFDTFKSLNCMLLAGISRKSMITRLLGIKPAGALNATTVLNTIALMKGADILRVHDVSEAVEAIRLISMLDQKNDNFA